MGAATSYQPHRVLLLGIDGSGKSSIAARVCGEDVRTTLPSRGVASRSVAVGGTPLELVDVGGAKDLRQYWASYAGGRSAGAGEAQLAGRIPPLLRGVTILYVIDACDRRRLLEAARELQAVLDNPVFGGAPLLVVANKQDRATAAPAPEIEAALYLNTVRDRHCQCIGVSALRGDGLAQALEWCAASSRRAEQGDAPTSAEDPPSLGARFRKALPFAKGAADDDDGHDGRPKRAVAGEQGGNRDGSEGGGATAVEHPEAEQADDTRAAQATRRQRRRQGSLDVGEEPRVDADQGTPEKPVADAVKAQAVHSEAEAAQAAKARRDERRRRATGSDSR